jgi:glycine cleavage system H protein
MVNVGDFEVREGLYYHKEHFWAKVEDGAVKVGITDYGQDGLQEVVVVQVSSVGDTVTQNEPYGVVESTKAVVDLIAPVSGKIKEVNEDTINNPKLINEDPYGKGWIVAITPSNLDEELKNIMNFKAGLDFYKEFASLTLRGW